MSLPNYLAKIKSSGLYRFTFDKSQIPPQAAETMRLVVGYSEKGPFNNPVYIDNKQDFINLFGNISKRLERKGVFFHRLALQALSYGPILALNLKPFANNDNNNGEGDNTAGTMEAVNCVSFNPCDNEIDLYELNVRDLYDRHRFWKIDADQLPNKIKKNILGGAENGYINIAATDSKALSCSIFVRNCAKNSVKQYDVTLRDWYNNIGEEYPEYLVGYEDTLASDYFAEVYVFRGEFTDALMSGALKDYFNADAKTLTTEYKNMFGKPADALAALAEDPNSNLVGIYRGSTLPFFKDTFGNFVSLDVVFNADTETHKMIMKLDDTIIDSQLDSECDLLHNILLQLPHWGGNKWTESSDLTPINTAMKPLYIKGYEYNTIKQNDTASNIYTKSLGVLSEEGIFTALTNRVDSEFHYIVDTFATIVSSDAEISTAKHNIAAIAKAKDNCLAIMNAPAMNDYMKTIANFSMKNLERGQYDSYFTLPSEVNGASWCAFYTPLVFAEGALKITVPSAALVSNNFMEKWNSRQPYYIVAGPNYGVMNYEGLIGPDYNYGREDLDIFEPRGINCMVYVPRKGTYINSNQTAKQKPVSALSKVHVRELVIYLQNEIEAILQNYQWELNTQTLRDTIKTSADTLLERIKANGGVYDYLNVCDGTNNTPEVIDNEMVILDTSIEPARGAGKMVQRLTIHRTGGISSLTK